MCERSRLTAMSSDKLTELQARAQGSALCSLLGSQRREMRTRNRNRTRPAFRPRLSEMSSYAVLRFVKIPLWGLKVSVADRIISCHCLHHPSPSHLSHFPQLQHCNHIKVEDCTGSNAALKISAFAEELSV